MTTACEASVAELERKLEQASADLSKVKRTAGIATAVVLAGGFVYVLWRMFSNHEDTESPSDGA